MLKSEKRNWNYIALGDSFTWGFPQIYASYIETDLGVSVKVHNFSVGGQGSDELLDALRGNALLRSSLGKADVVTFMIPMAYFKEPSLAYLSRGDVENKDCMPVAFALYQQDTEDVFKELLLLRKPSDAIFRVMDCYLPPFLFHEWKRRGVYRALKLWWEVFNDYVIQAAYEHQIPVARVCLAFNGSMGNVSPIDYIREDGWHTNERGAALIAQLHRDLGYAPLEL